MRIMVTLADNGQLDIFIYVTSNKEFYNPKVQFNFRYSLKIQSSAGDNATLITRNWKTFPAKQGFTGVYRGLHRHQ